jgi:SHS2 domain-containing protein
MMMEARPGGPEERALGGTAQSGYETFDHTADVGLLVRGRDMEDLFVQAAAGLIALLFGAGPVQEELLVAWLEEILMAFELEGLAIAGVDGVRLGRGVVTGELAGEPFDAARHELCTHVKAVTYHDLVVRRSACGCEVRLVLDV